MIVKKRTKDPRKAVAENMFNRHMKKEGFIIHAERSRELMVMFTKGESVELSQAIEKLQREGNFSPFLRDLNSKLIQYLKAVKHYGD